MYVIVNMVDGVMQKKEWLLNNLTQSYLEFSYACDVQ